MAFGVASDYDRFMGRWSRRLAPGFAAFAGVAGGQRVLDVGCGSGVLTRHLVDVVGADHVAAIDPALGFVQAVRSAHPDVDVREGVAESLPWLDASFDAVLAQLVLKFVADPATAACEMARVCSPEGTVAAASWDYPRMGMLQTFWAAVHDVLPDARDEAVDHRYATTDQLAGLWRDAGLDDVRTSVLQVSEEYDDAEDCWRPLTLGVGPAGDFARGLDEPTLERVHGAFVARVGGEGGFSLTADALCVAGARR